jgi:hypothetical protein
VPRQKPKPRLKAEKFKIFSAGSRGFLAVASASFGCRGFGYGFLLKN